MRKILNLKKKQFKSSNSANVKLSKVENSITTSTNSNISLSSLSKGQKKRLIKKNKIKIKLGINKPEFNKLSIQQQSFGFSSFMSELESSLPNVESDVIIQPAAISQHSNKMKKQIALRETQRMKLVQQHPSFIENPISAINNHLKHMVNMKVKSSSANC